MNDTATIRADILKALAQPTRLKIIDFLRDGERCVCEIFPAIGEEQSNTSRHLNMMLASGILSRRKDGLKIFYAIKHPEVLEIVDLAARIMTHEITGRHKLLKAI
ncbi:ArsR/SmtB family transcription factor [Geotalea uraniireducens]|uniref:Transcriptional regulator, ArsR family n=1 Tax=Geotalea uraniireducens (strain Rf4) TaxID=351605 RepID=A5GCN6_GEOUR|nr:metalloregulator ArsR/SmtB family transcription factor [Geotalea uraniireducens]ABQ24655.1 transcriptional regulator, ArsR family [Geotalea uraniireducens Rf4]